MRLLVHVAVRRAASVRVAPAREPCHNPCNGVAPQAFTVVLTV